MNHQITWWYLFFTDCQNAFVTILYLQARIIVGGGKKEYKKISTIQTDFRKKPQI